MNKILGFTISLLLIIITIIFIINPSLIINTVIETTYVFFKNVFPSIFPFLILSYFLINYNVLYYISITINKLFKIDINILSLILLSMFGGFPSNAKYIKMYYENGYIDEVSKNKLISILCFPSIIFTLGTIGNIYLNNYILGLKILMSIYITNFILLFKFKIKNSKPSKIVNTKKFGTILNESIKNSIEVLFIILGSMVVFTILINIIKNYANINDILLSFINCILEISSGTKKISILDINTNLKCILISLSLVFGGFAIHSQILSIDNINYKDFLFTRIKAVFLNVIIIWLFLNM